MLMLQVISTKSAKSGSDIYNYIRKMLRINSKEKKNFHKQDNSDFCVPDNAIPEESHDNQSFCLKTQKKMRSKLKKERIYRKKNHGSWTAIQERKFSDFMKKKRSIFEDKQLRRSCKIFKQMAQSIKTRSSEQCRSHHQKYELKLHTFDSIISYVESKIYELERPRPLQSDSEYEFLQVQGSQWQNNPVYVQRTYSICKKQNKQKQPSLKKNTLVNTSSGQQYRNPQMKNKKHLQPTQLQQSILKQINGQWKLIQKQENAFTVEICFDNFI